MRTGICESGPERQRPGETVHSQSDRSEPGAGDASDREICREWDCSGPAGIWAAFHVALQPRRHWTVSAGGRGARHFERAGDAENPVPGVFRVRRHPLRAAGEHFGGAHLQSAQTAELPRKADGLHQDPANSNIHGRAPTAQPGRTARVPASGHGASGRPGRNQGRLPYRRRRRSHSMADRWRRAAYLRSVAETGAGKHVGAVSVPYSRLPLRQRQRVHQPHGGGVAEQAAERADQVAPAAFQRQRTGGDEKRSGDPKHMGFDHIAAGHADSLNIFYEEHFNPYLNFQRPCGVPELQTDGKGKTRRTYKWYATPWEILRQLPGVAGYLNEDLTVDELERLAGAQSDTGAASKMQQAKAKLFAGFAQRKSAGGEKAAEMTGCGQ